MNYAKKIQQLEKQLAAARAKQAKEDGKRYLALARSEGHKTVDELIKALAAFASPVLKGKLGASKAKAPKAAKAAPVAVKAPAKTKVRRKRAKITDETRAAVKKLVEAGKTGGAIAKELGISLPSVQNIKKALGLVKKGKKK